MANYTPTEFHKDAMTRTVESWREHYQALWEGWTPGGPAPELPPVSDTELEYVRDQMKATYARGQASTQAQRTLYLGPGGSKTGWSFTAVSGSPDNSANYTVANDEITGTATASGTDDVILRTDLRFVDGRIGATVMSWGTATAYDVERYVGIVAKSHGAERVTAFLRTMANGERQVSVWHVSGFTYNLLAGWTAIPAEAGTGVGTGDVWMDLECEVLGDKLTVLVNGRNVVSTTIPAAVLPGTAAGFMVKPKYAQRLGPMRVIEYGWRKMPDSIDKILVLGTSIAAGVGASSAASSYRERIADKLSDRFTKVRPTVINGGFSGQKSDYILGQVGSLLAQTPDVVFVETPINDAKKAANGIDPLTTYANVRRIVKKVKAAGAIPVLMTSAPVDAAAMNNTEWGIPDNYIRQNHHNSLTRRLAVEEGIILADIFRGFGGSASNILVPDNIHPGDAGHDLYAETAVNALLEATRW